MIVVKVAALRNSHREAGCARAKAQNVICGAQPFALQAFSFVARAFWSRESGNKIEAPFFKTAVGEKTFSPLLVFDVLVEKHFLLFSVAEKNLKGAFRYYSVFAVLNICLGTFLYSP